MKGDWAEKRIRASELVTAAENECEMAVMELRDEGNQRPNQPKL